MSPRDGIPPGARPPGETRWDGDAYQRRFDELAAAGADVHGEAALVLSFAPGPSWTPAAAPVGWLPSWPGTAWRSSASTATRR